MSNLSDLTRKDQVLAKLRENINQWVDGPDLANETVGGSEGLRRLRDLKAEGYLIQERAHPQPGRAVHQYRLVEQSTVGGGTTDRPSYPPAPHYPPTGYDHAPGPAMRQVPTQPPKPQEDRRDWRLESAVRNEWRCEFWIRQPKQRIIGTIALDFDRQRWFWSVKRPKYHGKYGDTRPEKTLASGIVLVEETKSTEQVIRDAAIRAGREEAKHAVEHAVKELKEADSL